MKRSHYERLRGSTSLTARIAAAGLLLFSLITLLLIPNIMLSSVKTKSDLINNTMGFPRSFTLENYRTVFVEDHFFRYMFNSVILSVMALASLLLIASMTAYGLSRYKFKGNNFLQVYFLLGLMFPIQLGILPIFIIIRSLGLINSLWGMILIYTANLSLPVFIFSRFFRSLPRALYESARIDGAGEFRIYAQIMVPISKPVFATVGIINFVTIWNDFFMPLVFLTGKQVRTLTLGIYQYMNNFLANWHLVFAAVTAALIPVFILFFLFTSQLVEGLTAGAVKE
ncbi:MULTISPECIES: carbohydrate ABC transporter permease [unclassified Oceanispirochaeta]|uniref:carbohydrate ABC transporter permease n=1 Tax=unclassified Oceanispirochaeta TaxID=2635722 RepID=UPI000E08EC68|nr:MULTISPECIES: carbohydrate ABC transporter permease [unclassified Oceanispirochaeta]MBF9017602.1 carbohydrate ABC transporter permease [Oceanispirochaeta sp. M2]NPD74174.1 carbohydrate ABC transporter permease [Oceanispirochaeta sp. M1]RDG29987.1 carbohydrate ABC transporter permease [Oceanispirochaeta sp. M1]